MNESTIVRKLIVGLKGSLSAAVIDKHADRMTRNIPDVSVDYGGLTSWLEVKYLREGETDSKRRDHFTGSQLVRCCQRDRESYCRYFVAYHVNRTLYAGLVKPDDVRIALEQDKFDMLHTDLVGPFNEAVARLALTLKERSYVYHIRVDEDQEKTNRPGQKTGTIALRRGRYFAPGEVQTRRVAVPVPGRTAKIQTLQQPSHRRK